MNPSRLPHELAADALREGNFPAAGDWVLPKAVQLLCDAIGRAPAPLAADEAARAAKVLNAHLQYDLTLQLTEAWNQGPRFDLHLARQRAQALINRRRLGDAQDCIDDALDRLLAGGSTDPGVLAAEVGQLRGLRARLPKDRYVREYERRSDPSCQPDIDRENTLLNQAIREALELYRPNARAWWPGVNAIALLSRRARERDEASNEQAAAIAAELLAEIRAALTAHRVERDALDAEHERLRQHGGNKTHWQTRRNRWLADDAELHWLLASASEASLAVAGGGCREAELWLHRFIADPRTKPFDLASYERQLREIWQGDDNEYSRWCPSRLVAILTRHQRAATRSVSFSAQDARRLRGDEVGLEKNFSGESQFSVSTIREMLGICASIGRVREKDYGKFIGTGFLVDLKALSPQRDSEIVFVTNAHVISRDESGAAHPDSAEITFELAEARGQPRVYTVADVLFYSPPGDLGVRLPTHDALDLCVVRLSPTPEGLVGLRVANELPRRGPRTKAYVIGHPEARPMQVSLHDSALLDYDDLPRLVHYRTPTDPGSSGSPVFDESWNVIAVHHAGRRDAPRLDGQGYYEANEGVALAALRACLAR